MVGGAPSWASNMVMRKGEGLIPRESAIRRAPPEVLDAVIAGTELARQYSGLEPVHNSYIMTVSLGAK